MNNSGIFPFATYTLSGCPDYSEIFYFATYTLSGCAERFRVLRDNRDGAVCVETSGDPVCCDTWSEFLDLCSESGYVQEFGFVPLDVEPYDWENSFGHGEAEWLKARSHSEIEPRKWLPRCVVDVDIDYYVTSSGYSHTETFEHFNTDEFVSAQAYWDGMDPDAAEPFFPAVKDGWLETTLSYYAEDDNGRDTAIYISSCTVSAGDPAFDDCRDEGDDYDEDTDE